MRQVAYLMADISKVQIAEIKDLFASLEALSCKSHNAGHQCFCPVLSANYSPSQLAS